MPQYPLSLCHPEPALSDVNMLRTMLARPRLPRELVRPRQQFSTSAKEEMSAKNQRTFVYASSIIAGVLGLAYAAVPLYKVFCQATGFGGEVKRADIEKFEKMTPSTTGRLLKITFNADTSDTMPWSFKPSQRYVEVHPGETALAFFRAKNNTDKPVTGVATYNVTPMRAGVYFNKIQCFCFEEQRLKPREEVDMPVFFYVDPEMEDDPHMDGVRTLTLSYTFFPTEHKAEEEEMLKLIEESKVQGDFASPNNSY
jgi:cytochrome c oxidase assembly protein subunit 11